MPVLELTYDPAWAAVRIVVDGGMWSAPVDTIRIVRTSPGYPEIPVRGVEMLPVAGGYWIGTDHEMPLNATVQYTVTGYSEGVEVESATQSVSTVTAGQALWIKAPGQPDLSQRVRIRSVGEILSDTLGDAYQPAAGGPAIPQWGGASANYLPLVVMADHPRALLSMLDQARTVLVQPEGDPEIQQGWYFVSLRSLVPIGARVGLDVYGTRAVRLALTETIVPAGLGVPATGVSWATVMEQHTTWQDVIDDVPTWFDLQKGA